MGKPVKVAPVPMPDQPIERTKEYNDFIADLTAYHERRGTILDPEPRIGTRHIDLRELYNRVTAEGGYDAVSEVKLAWRKVATDFIPMSSQHVAHAFQLKTVYYKNLAAYEISTFFKREPPPKEILEDVSAKGGDLLNRTLDNFRPRPTHEIVTEEIAEPEGRLVEPETLVAARRNRPARQVQPRVFFDPAPVSTRQVRATSRQTHSPAPAAASQAYNAPAHAFNVTPAPAPIPPGAAVLAGYEPMAAPGVEVQAVSTPATDPARFENMAAARKVRMPMPGVPRVKGMMLPGTGFPGPNIYTRIYLALRSGVRSEITYALHHMVKISFERGDKYKLSTFPGLSEAILETILRSVRVFYGKTVRPCYSASAGEAAVDDYGVTNDNLFGLDGLFGTADLLGRLEALSIVEPDDSLETVGFAGEMKAVTEAALVLRNLSLLMENAIYLSRIAMAWDALAIVLSLPLRPSLVEAQLYCVETVEQLAGFGSPTSGQARPLFCALVRVAEKSTDRGAIVCALRALGRFSAFLPTPTRMGDLPAGLLVRLADWLLVEDAVLREASLSVLYVVSSSPAGVIDLSRGVGIDRLIGQLVRLVMAGAVFEPDRRERVAAVVVKPVESETPPRLPGHVGERLLAISDLREQSAEWLRISYQDDASAEVSQLGLWNSYNGFFGRTGRMLTAKDFIATVSTVFSGATAQQSASQANLYTISGIRPRDAPLGPSGRPFLVCGWKPDGEVNVCGHAVELISDLTAHLLSAHLEPLLQPGGDTAAATSTTPTAGFMCRWTGCGRLFSSTREIGRHLTTHWPDQTKAKPTSQTRIAGGAAKEGSRSYWTTPSHDPVTLGGVPIAAILVLRNLARQLPRVENRAEMSDEFAVPDEMAGDPNGGTQRDEIRSEIGVGSGRRIKSKIVARAFGPYRDMLFYCMAYNLSLREHLGSLAHLIADVSGGIW